MPVLTTSNTASRSATISWVALTALYRTALDHKWRPWPVHALVPAMDRAERGRVTGDSPYEYSRGGYHRDAYVIPAASATSLSIALHRAAESGIRVPADVLAVFDAAVDVEVS